MMTSIKEMVIQHLKSIGADGLYNGEDDCCGCEISDLMPCWMFHCDDCVAGWRGKNNENEFGYNSGWAMYPTKADADASWQAAEESEEDQQ